MGWKITAAVFWAAMLVLITMMATINVNEVKTFDLSGIQAQEIVAGTNLIKPDFTCSLVTDFTARSYSLVMAGVVDPTRGEFTLLGLADNKYYRTRESFPLACLQAVKDVRVIDRTLNITCGKNGAVLGVFIFLSVVILGGLGALFWKLGRRH